MMQDSKSAPAQGSDQIIERAEPRRMQGGGMSHSGDDDRREPLKDPAKAASEAGPRTVHAHIGDSLRRMFEEVVEEPIPEKFKALLESLEKSKSDGA